MGRFVEAPVPVRYENDIMIVPVVVKRLRLTEELHITPLHPTVSRLMRVWLADRVGTFVGTGLDPV